jgi:hypothetical protein
MCEVRLALAKATAGTVGRSHSLRSLCVLGDQGRVAHLADHDLGGVFLRIVNVLSIIPIPSRDIPVCSIGTAAC